MPSTGNEWKGMLTARKSVKADCLIIRYQLEKSIPQNLNILTVQLCYAPDGHPVFACGETWEQNCQLKVSNQM